MSQVHTVDLVLANSIMAGARGIFENFMENFEVKQEGIEYFAIFLSITHAELVKGVCMREMDGKTIPLRVQTIISKAQKSVGGANDIYRIPFVQKLKQFKNSIAKGAPNELVLRHQRELQDAHIDALDNDCSIDQQQMRGAFNVFAHLIDLLKVGENVEAADQVQSMTNEIKAMQEQMSQAQRQREEQSQKEKEEVAS